jgi:hypothetical protein
MDRSTRGQKKPEQSPHSHAVNDHLADLLALHRVVSTASSSAMRNQSAETGYRAIGAGQCGQVREVTGTTDVLKLAKANDRALWNDYRMHTRVMDGSKEIQSARNLRIPNVSYFISRADDKWWGKHHELFVPSVRQTDALCSDRIFPLPKPTRQRLIQFCPQQLHQRASEDRDNTNCLAWVLLGQRKPTDRVKPVTHFSL